MFQISSAETVAAKRKMDTALMPPPPPPPLPKRQKRPAKVLDEDVYSHALSHIIARDYFPGLLESQAQQEYLTALDSNNNDWIRDAGRKLTQVMTPGPGGRKRGRRGTSFTPRRTTGSRDTPRSYVGGTPTPTQTPTTERGEDHFAPEPKPEVDISMSLGDFQAKYTSEDNESFNALLDTQNVRRAAKYEFFHRGNKIPTARQIAYRAKEQKLLENGGRTTSTPLITTNAGGEERQALAHARPSAELDTRPASVDSFPNRQGPRNHFMFGPDGVEDYTTTHAQQREATSVAPPKTVTFTATRLPSVSEQARANLFPPSSSLSAIDAAIAGRPKPTASEPGYSGADTPRVNGYAFVDAEHTPSELGVPISDGEADALEREEVMKLLPKAEADGDRNPFVMSEQSAREGLRDRLVEKADTARRKSARGQVGKLAELGIVTSTPGSGVGTPRFTSAPKVLGRKGMTPAGRMLSASLGKTPLRGNDGKGLKLEAGWEKTPKVRKVL
ncbi:hypothetical protein LTR62_001718 [Meristemomyces frigidus]|uniref:Protein DGCR14 n=1 Tax=Meristemomyces frigidus TaxID=1508187 RepID=A0AAN7T8T0_9PEZI|nr:hypothetical protein LTR62_001718 [Meristemomyces frigidus]